MLDNNSVSKGGHLLKIENIKTEIRSEKKWVAATIRWEECEHEDFEVFFEIDEKFADDFDASPHGAISAYLIPALRHGEERIFIDAEICPQFKEGADIAMRWMSHWFFGAERKPVQIEARTRSTVPTPSRPPRAGLLFSGGIDSMTVLRMNRLNFPLDHPGSVKDGIFAFGFDVRFEETFDEMVDSLSGIVQEAGITLLPFASNLYTHYLQLDADALINQNPGVWQYQYQGGALAGAAHLFANRLDAVRIANTYDIANLRPFGNHPMIEPNFSSYDLRIHHDGITLSRLEKVKLIADWDVGLNSIRVCNQITVWDEKTQNFKERNPFAPGELNCCRCWKCVVTMLALMIAGALHKASTFPQKDISPQLIRKTFIPSDQNLCDFVELIAPLQSLGRDDLADAITHQIDIYMDREPGVKGLVKRIDRKYLDGKLTRLKNTIQNAK